MLCRIKLFSILLNLIIRIFKDSVTSRNSRLFTSRIRLFWFRESLQENSSSSSSTTRKFKIKSVDPKPYIANDYQATEFTVVKALDRVAVLFTATERRKIGLVTFDQDLLKSNKTWVDFSKDSKGVNFQEDIKGTKTDITMAPTGISCKEDPIPTSANQITCFVDTFGASNYIFKFAPVDMNDVSTFVSGLTMLPYAHISPRGYQRAKTVLSGEYVGVLYKRDPLNPPTTEEITAKKPLACPALLEIYKQPNMYSYITYTCDDFLYTWPANGDNTFNPTFGMNGKDILISQHKAPAPAPSPATRRLLGENESRILQGTGNIGIRETSVFKANVPKDASLTSIMFKTKGIDGTFTERSMDSILKGVNEHKDDVPPPAKSNFWFWFWLILVILILIGVGVFIYMKMSKSVESSDAKETYGKDVSNSRPSDLDDTRL
jgi:hypothetical protein